MHSTEIASFIMINRNHGFIVLNPVFHNTHAPTNHSILGAQVYGFPVGTLELAFPFSDKSFHFFKTRALRFRRLGILSLKTDGCGSHDHQGQ